MGCGASTSAQQPAQKEQHHQSQSTKESRSGGKSKRSKGGEKESKDPDVLPGRNKYILEPCANVMEVEEKKGQVSAIVLVYGTDSNIVFAARELKTNNLFFKEFTDQQLGKEKEAAGVTLGWAAFFKSIASDITKSKARVSISPTNVTVEVTVTSAKDTKGNSQPFSVKLDAKPKTPQNFYRHIIEPMVRMLAKKRQNSDEKDKEGRYAKLESEKLVKESSLSASKATVDKISPIIRPLREEAAAASKASTELQQKVGALERRLKRMQQGGDTKNALDAVLEDGGARPFNHIPWADEHIPKETDPNEIVLELVKEKFPLKSGEDIQAIMKSPTNPMIQKMIEQAPPGVADTAMKILTHLDQWDLPIFELDRVTNGGALFHITYALMYKMNLVQHFNLDDKILRSFLMAIQAGYHPNPYHNAIHAADVTQINYFIMTKGGLASACQLSMEDMLAGLLSGAIHDFDHPGFNNNFHTRTSAYLSTLYNDKSILENHHLACVFELVRLPKYNIFAPLSEDKRKDIRDTMIEMVLSTDMGNHAKIFGQFRRRLSEGCEWSQRKDDVRLALSMSIKMADISNCGRPNNLYVEWAKNIATEFYHQGDVEAKLKLSISPFMDRRKDKTDFPKGQISFMNFIVVPMFEAIAEFLPGLEFVLRFVQENKEYWQNTDE